MAVDWRLGFKDLPAGYCGHGFYPEETCCGNVLEDPSAERAIAEARICVNNLVAGDLAGCATGRGSGPECGGATLEGSP